MPLENHLLALKQLVYNEAYTNAVKPCETHGLTLCDKHDIKYIFRPDTAGDIMNLFMMTPYYYTSSENDRAKIKNAAFLETEAEFRILVYQLNKI